MLISPCTWCIVCRGEGRGGAEHDQKLRQGVLSPRWAACLTRRWAPEVAFLEAHRVKKMADNSACSSASFVRPDSLLLKWLEETSAALPKDGMLKVSGAGCG